MRCILSFLSLSTATSETRGWTRARESASLGREFLAFPSEFSARISTAEKRRVPFFPADVRGERLLRGALCFRRRERSSPALTHSPPRPPPPPSSPAWRRGGRAGAEPRVRRASERASQSGANARRQRTHAHSLPSSSPAFESKQVSKAYTLARAPSNAAAFPLGCGDEDLISASLAENVSKMIQSSSQRCCSLESREGGVETKSGRRQSSHTHHHRAEPA